MGVEGLRAEPETVTEQQEWRKTGEKQNAPSFEIVLNTV